MIYGFAQDIASMLSAQKFPVDVVYGPERLERVGFCDAVIVIERDRDSSDTFSTAIGSRANPRMLRSRALAAKATIYARSSLPGAHIGDHEFLCEQILDGLFCAIVNWGHGGGAGEIPVSDGRYIDPRTPSHKALEGFAPGVCYELKFRVSRGVSDVDFTGAGKLTGTPAHVQGTANVQVSGQGSEVVTLPRAP